MYIGMNRLNRAFDHVRSELREVGLLEDGIYLDKIDLVRATLPALSTMGYFFDTGTSWFDRLVGFKEATVYVPIVAPIEKHRPGHTLLDVIRHEFAHAWAWLDPRRVNGAWFHKTFGGPYASEWPDDAPEFDSKKFVSKYATTSPAEDFAESFMMYLRCRRSLERLRSRRRLHRKLTAVASLVRATATELRLK
jgi:hypothetical protein